MKKIFGIVVPLSIVLIISGLLLLTCSTGRKGLGCDLMNEPGVQAGMKDAQIWIQAFEKYKSMHGKYPANLEDLDRTALRIGQGYSHPNVTGISPYFESEDGFEVTFTFKNDYACLAGQARRCAYRSENKNWTCD